MLAADAIGIIGINNNNPLEKKDANVARYLLQLNIMSNTMLTATFASPHTMEEAAFLGGIVQDSRQTVVWVNNTKPLP